MNHDDSPSPVPSAPTRTTRARRAGVGAVVALVALAACSPAGGSPQPTTGPSGSPTATDTPTDGSAIDHPTGAKDVVFRFEEGGGFVPMDFFATQAPQFTLYGDGTVIFRDGNAAPPPNNGVVSPLAPFMTARLSEAQVQELLRFALADSGLGIARASYNPGNVADAPTATFTVHAGGLDKTVSVEALGFDNPQSPDALILRAMAGLGERLRSFASFVEGEVVWTPDRWRGVLTPDAFNPPIPWPWDDLTPADFVQPQAPDAPQFPIHTLTPAQVEALGFTGIEGGFLGIAMTGPDGKAYTFTLRPILPDEPF